MDNKERKEKIEQKINDISKRLQDLKSRVPDEKDIKEKLNDIIKNMEKTRNEIIGQYEMAKKSGEKNWSKINENIYRDLESFEESFRKAGAIFRPERGNKKSTK